MSSRRTRIVLVGAGHAHLVCLRHLGPLLRAGARVTLVDPDRFRYSGTATAVLEGRLSSLEGSVDPAAPAARYGVEFVRSRVIRIDRKDRQVMLRDGNPLPYDLLSINTGSGIAHDLPSDGSLPVLRVKPISELFAFGESLRREGASRPDADGRPLRVAVVGGGPSGCEVAAVLATLSGVRVTLLQGASRLLSDFPKRAARLAHRRLEALGVDIRTGVRVEAVEGGRLRAADRCAEAVDRVVLAAGLRPRVGLDGLDDLLQPSGGLGVGADLRCPAAPEIFAAGDCAVFLPSPLPPIGVYGVRQGACLARGFRAILEGREPEPFRPQRRTLLILNLGAGYGLACRGGLAAGGGWAGWWKRRIDNGFLRELRQP